MTKSSDFRSVGTRVDGPPPRRWDAISETQETDVAVQPEKTNRTCI
jgi:hypothetical protein